jgi:hypothetical protein
MIYGELMDRYSTMVRMILDDALKCIVGFEGNYIDRVKQVVGSKLIDVVSEALDRVTPIIVMRKNNGLIYCRLCSKGPFTKRGLYLHLRRIHRDEIEAKLLEEISRIIGI